MCSQWAATHTLVLTVSNVARIQTEATESLREFLHIGKVDAVDMSDCVPSYGIMEGIEAAVGMCVRTYLLPIQTYCGYRQWKI